MCSLPPGSLHFRGRGYELPACGFVDLDPQCKTEEQGSFKERWSGILQNVPQLVFV
jgi:hypothetical protein